MDKVTFSINVQLDGKTPKEITRKIVEAITTEVARISLGGATDTIEPNLAFKAALGITVGVVQAGKLLGDALEDTAREIRSETRFPLN